MNDNPFATPQAPTNLAEGAAQAPAEDLDFDATVTALQLGLFPARVCAVKKGTGDYAHKLIVEFKLEGGAVGETVSKWADPTNRDDMVKIAQVVNALGVDMVNDAGKLKPECGWNGLIGRPALVAVDEWNGRLTIPRFGKIQSDDCPAEYKDRDFGCGVLPPE